jgi:heterodisulfide reductase subunit C
MEVDLRSENLSSPFVREVEEIIGGSVWECYQCGNCTAGCPASFAMDLGPARLLRFLQLGLKERVLLSNTPWVCAACVTCTTRCPQEVDIARVMDAVRMIGLKEGPHSRFRSAKLLHRVFIGVVRKYGRQHELSLLAGYNILSGKFFKDILLAPGMFLKGKLKVFPRKVKGRKELAEIFRRTEI